MPWDTKPENFQQPLPKPPKKIDISSVEQARRSWNMDDVGDNCSDVKTCRLFRACRLTGGPLGDCDRK